MHSGEKKKFELVESSIPYVLSKSLLKCYATSFRKSGEACANDVYPGTQHNGTSASSLYLLVSKLCFKINSFLSLESELSFDSDDSEINGFD